MSHVMDLPNTLAEIDKLQGHDQWPSISSAFDPADVDEFVLHTHWPTKRLARPAGMTVEVPAAEGTS